MDCFVDKAIQDSNVQHCSGVCICHAAVNIVFCRWKTFASWAQLYVCTADPKFLHQHLYGLFFSYCGTPGLSRPKGTCRPGYYCPQGSFVPEPQDHRCPAGSKCPGGSGSPTTCDAEMNEYQPSGGQPICETCPSGFTCTTKAAVVCPVVSQIPSKYSAHNYELCLFALIFHFSLKRGMSDVANLRLSPPRLRVSQGHYCQPGVGAQQCDKGTFNPLTGSESPQSCLECLPGWACSQKGLSAPDKKCTGGHFCTLGALNPEPTEEWNEGGGICTPGYICPEGSIYPRPCPSGSYCSRDKLTEPEGECKEGHFCAHQALDMASSAEVNLDQCPSSITQGICPPGSVCPSGSAFPFKCPAGRLHQQTTFNLSRDTCCYKPFY